jgi:hypothetical protein
MKNLIDFVFDGGIGDKNGVGCRFFFKNGYGASIVKHKYSYGGNDGLYELAVLKGNKEESHLCYNSGITGDVIGYLEPPEAIEYLIKIRNLPKVGKKQFFLLRLLKRITKCIFK